MATTKQLNPGVLSAARGGELIFFGFRINGVSNPDSLWQCGSNAVVSVTRAAAGRFTVTLNKSYPREIVALVGGTVEELQAATTLFVPRMVRDSYSNTAGTFTLQTMADANGDGAWAEADPTDNATVSVVMLVQRMDALVTSHGS